jgi:hypothetical protein
LERRPAPLYTKAPFSRSDIRLTALRSRGRVADVAVRSFGV